MRFLEADAILSDVYMRDCYDAELEAKNHGFLTLVSPLYFDFGRNLMTVVSQAISQDSLEKQGNTCARNSKSGLKNNHALRECFLNIASSFKWLGIPRKQ
jgi:hypothetical protein